MSMSGLVGVIRYSRAGLKCEVYCSCVEYIRAGTSFEVHWGWYEVHRGWCEVH